VGEFVLSFIDTNGEVYHKSIINLNGKYWVVEYDLQFDTIEAVKKELKRRCNIGVHLPRTNTNWF